MGAQSLKARMRWDRAKGAVLAIAVSLLVVAALSGLWILVRPPQANVDAVALNASAAADAALARSSRYEAAMAARTAFLGDSYTAGSGASATDRRFSSIVASGEGWQEINFGVGGTGFFNERTTGANPALAYPNRLDSVVDSQPATIIVTGGRNDVGQWNRDSKPVADNIESTIRILRQRLPDARIIIVSPMGSAETPAPSAYAAMASVERLSAIAVGAEFIDIGQPLEGRPDLVEEDQVHPNDAGHAALADAILNALDQ